MKERVKKLLIELVNDAFSYWLPFVICCLYIAYKLPDQQDIIVPILGINYLWNYWRCKDLEYQIEQLETRFVKAYFFFSYWLGRSL